MNALVAGWVLVELLAGTVVVLAILARRKAREVTAVKMAAVEEVTEAFRHASAWRKSFTNLEVLRDLQVRFAGLEVTIFGSSLQAGAFQAPAYWSDVDLMIEVDEETFAAWAAKVYPAETGVEEEPVIDYNSWPHEGTEIVVMGRPFVVAPYSAAYPTRIARRWAAEEILGVDFDIKVGADTADFDVFLFPHSFVRGEFAIPAWDGTDTGRSFRAEVLAGAKLADLQPYRPE